jgi:hypothetical protein
LGDGPSKQGDLESLTGIDATQVVSKSMAKFAHADLIHVSQGNTSTLWPHSALRPQVDLDVEMMPGGRDDLLNTVKPERLQVPRADQPDQAGGAAALESSITGEQWDVQEHGQGDVLRVVCLGPSELIRDLPGPTPEIRRLDPLDRSRSQGPESVVRELIADVTSVALLMNA